MYDYHQNHYGQEVNIKNYMVFSTPIADFLKNSCMVNDPDGKPIFNGLSGNGWKIWAEQADYVAKIQQENAAQSQAYAAKKQEIYNKYCQKYGKKYVDAALDSKILLGTPLTFLKDVFDLSLDSESNYAERYTVIVHKPVYSIENGTLSSRGIPHIKLVARKVYVTVQNGVVTDLINL